MRLFRLEATRLPYFARSLALAVWNHCHTHPVGGYSFVTCLLIVGEPSCDGGCMQVQLESEMAGSPLGFRPVGSPSQEKATP